MALSYNDLLDDTNLIGLDIFELPIEITGPVFSFSVPISNALYWFKFQWITRQSFWFVTIANGFGQVIEQRKKIECPGFVFHYASSSSPPGLFAINDKSPDLEKVPIDMDNFGINQRFGMIYVAESPY